MLDNLRQLGWSDYEARAYIGLLESAPATGYRVAKASGVPVAKVYEALARLVERGAARILPTHNQPDGANRNAQYTATPPEELLAGVRARHAQMLDELARDLAQIRRGEPDAEAAQWLHGVTPILGRSASLISGARKSVSVAAAPVWEPGLRGVLEKATARRVRVERVTLPEGATARPISGPSESLLLVVSVDGTETLIAHQSAHGKEAEAEAMSVSSPFLAQLCGDYVRLRRAVALVPEVVTRLDRQDGWLDWEESKQRRLLQTSRSLPEPISPRTTPQ